MFYVLYSVGEFYYLLASGVGFCVAVTHSYILNKFWTFKRRGSRVREEFIKFFLVNIFSLAINLSGMAIFVELLAVQPPIAQMITIGLTLAINFLGNKFWTFRTYPKLN